MRVEYINPFVETSYRVLKEVLGGAEVKRGNLYLKSTAMPVMGVAALVGLAGDVEGRVLFDMTLETALNIASKMNGEKLEVFDDLAKATISELANLITAQAGIVRRTEDGNSSIRRNIRERRSFDCSSYY